MAIIANNLRASAHEPIAPRSVSVRLLSRSFIVVLSRASMYLQSSASQNNMEIRETRME